MVYLELTCITILFFPLCTLEQKSKTSIALLKDNIMDEVVSANTLIVYSFLFCQQKWRSILSRIFCFQEILHSRSWVN
jgi:hypothetical protein